jgi:hypothetical protein
MKREQFNDLFLDIISKIKKARDCGQKEYAHTEDNVFANFERAGSNLDISREQALMVYLLKHIDGINAWVKGHRSQREDVTGRMKDAIVYLCLLWGMALEDSDQENLDKFLDKSGFKTTIGPKFNAKTGEVAYEIKGGEDG